MSFKKPVNVNVTQRFGADFKQADGRWYYKQVLGYNGHNGDDYAAPAGTPVYAADEGTVAFEGWGQNHSWMGAPAGICVLIHNGGVYSGYAHLSTTNVNKGQKVSKGQLIGTVGSTGAATGPHLHFEALPLVPNFKNGYAGRIDPAQFAEAPVNTASADQVRQAYRDILEREADEGGIATYTQKTIDFVRSDLASSQEYRTLQANKAAAAQAAKDAQTAAELARQRAEQEAAAKAIAEAEAKRVAEELARQEAIEAAKNSYTQADRARDNETNNILKQLWNFIQSIFKGGK